MKKIAFLAVIIIFHLSLFSQRVDYKSRIYDGITYVPIAGASIYNFNTKSYSFSDEQGSFSIPAQAGDTLIISKSVYRQLMTVLTQEDISLGLNEYLLFYKAILLREVSVHSLNPSYEGFKRDLANIQLPGIYKKLEGIELSAEDKMNAEMATKGPNLLRNTPLASPITMLYNMFSKKVKTRQLYYEMLEYEDEIDKVPAKYNKELVSEITGLEGNDLMEFMVFCRFSYYDLIRWSEAEVVNAIRTKFSEYEYYKALEDE